jgi:hypothetical protein
MATEGDKINMRTWDYPSHTLVLIETLFQMSCMSYMISEEKKSCEELLGTGSVTLESFMYASTCIIDSPVPKH